MPPLLRFYCFATAICFAIHLIAGTAQAGLIVGLDAGDGEIRDVARTTSATSVSPQGPEQLVEAIASDSGTSFQPSDAGSNLTSQPAMPVGAFFLLSAPATRLVVKSHLVLPDGIPRCLMKIPILATSITTQATCQTFVIEFQESITGSNR